MKNKGFGNVLVFILVIVGIGVLGYFSWQKGLINYHKPNLASLNIVSTAESPDTKKFVDKRYGFSFELPLYYDTNPKSNSNSSLSNVIWVDFDGYSGLNIDTITNEAWISDDGGAESVRDLSLAYLMDTNYATWKNQAINISRPKNTIDQELELPNGFFIVSISCSPCKTTTLQVIDTALVVPIRNNLLVIQTHHFGDNQPEVNALFFKIYSTFKFTE